jgi:hypothetical protein
MVNITPFIACVKQVMHCARPTRNRQTKFVINSSGCDFGAHNGKDKTAGCDLATIFPGKCTCVEAWSAALSIMPYKQLGSQCTPQFQLAGADIFPIFYYICAGAAAA